MIHTNKVEGVNYDINIKDTKNANLNTHGETLFDYEIDEPMDLYSTEDGGSPWTQNLTTQYNNLGLGSYTWTKLNKIDDAAKKSQNNLIDLLRMYEGHGDNFEAKTNYKDNLNVSTYGFGLTTTAMKAIGNYDNNKKTVINKPTTQTAAYTQLLKYLNDVSLVETKNYLGTVKYDNLPKGIKGALLDYQFKNGSAIMKNSKLREKLEAAVKANTAAAWADVLKGLVYAYPASTNAAKVQKPGLHRRSLSRVILAAVDLKKKFSKPEDIAIIDAAVKTVYDNAVKCSKNNNNEGLNEINTIYKAYTDNAPTNNTTGQKTNSNTYTVPSKMSLYAAAGTLIPDQIPSGISSTDLRKKVINEIIKLNNLQTYGTDNNGYPSTDMLAQGTNLILPTSVKVGQINITLKKSSWVAVSNQAQQNNVTPNSSDSGDETDIDNESESSLSLLKNDCGNPTYKSIGASSKNLQCATFEYTVQSGDTMYGLANRYGVDPKTFLADNNMTEKNILEIGQKIKIKKVVYTVKKGDTLTNIASALGVTKDYMQDINQLNDINSLEIGQKLEIPAYIHKVKKGDIINDIAKNAGVTTDEIKNINGLANINNISIDQELIIPFKDSDYNVSASDKTKSNDDEGNEVTTIKTDTKRQYFTKNIVKGKCVAGRHVFKPTKAGKLSGKTIIVDAGHGYMPSGAMDAGAPGLKGKKSEVYANYDNAMKLTEKLCANGATVIFLQGYEGKNSQGAGLISNELKKSKNKADLFISIHANSSKKAPPTDRAEIYYHRDAKSTQGKKLAEIFEKKLDNKQNNANYAYSKSSGFQILRTAKEKNIPAILWEVAFINNKTGSDRLNSDKLMTEYADLLTNSVIEYFGGSNAASSNSSSPSSTNSANNTYTVKKGDTLGAIAKKYNTTVEKLKKLNPQIKNIDNIPVGSKIRIK